MGIPPITASLTTNVLETSKFLSKCFDFVPVNLGRSLSDEVEHAPLPSRGMLCHTEMVKRTLLKVSQYILEGWVIFPTEIFKSMIKTCLLKLTVILRPHFCLNFKPPDNGIRSITPHKSFNTLKDLCDFSEE